MPLVFVLSFGLFCVLSFFAVSKNHGRVWIFVSRANSIFPLNLHSLSSLPLKNSCAQRCSSSIKNPYWNNLWCRFCPVKGILPSSRHILYIITPLCMFHLHVGPILGKRKEISLSHTHTPPPLSLIGGPHPRESISSFCRLSLPPEYAGEQAFLFPPFIIPHPCFEQHVRI